jgi:hypothetical protein
MAIAAAAPLGGISAEIDGRSRPLLLRNGEIERFEVQHKLGIFAMLDQLVGRGEHPQARHVRDLVALGLVGGGMSDREADALIASLPAHQNLALRTIASDLVMTAFMPPKPQKKRAGSRRNKAEVTDSGTQKSAPAPSLPPD